MAVSRASRKRTFALRRLDLRPTGFNGRQVRRVGRQVQQPGAAASNGLLDARRLMGAQIVHHDDISGHEGGAQHLLDIGTKDLGGSTTADGHHGLQAVDAEGAQHRDIRPVVLGHAADDPLPWESAAIQPGKGQIDARFINKLQAPAIERRQPLAVDCPRLRDVCRVALRRVERLFLRGKPRRCSTRHMVGTLTRTPVAAATPVHSSCRVASG